MTTTSPGSVPPTRDPVGHGRAFTEGAVVLTPLGIIVAWLLTLLPVEIPQTVSQAIVGLVVAIGTLCFSEWRNRQYQVRLLRGAAGGGLVLILLPLLVLGCVSFDGDRYKAMAGPEIVALSSAPDSEPLSVERCFALKQAAKALRDDQAATSKSLNAPFFAGQHVPELALRFDRMGSACYEMADRDAARGVSPQHRATLRADWADAWREGRALLGGPEKE